MSTYKLRLGMTKTLKATITTGASLNFNCNKLSFYLRLDLTKTVIATITTGASLNFNCNKLSFYLRLDLTKTVIATTTTGASLNITIQRKNTGRQEQDAKHNLRKRLSETSTHQPILSEML
ncbi:hypothetical protein MAR_029065 [Mya arenaria]|uniref:Uncharacterized protein n=1 Tax=Mya arenaria TaxID=6604 RepID=A0ABY7DI44_MYAAR|nr:hypothetical protein MAR_029065 [Mya arenaria]